MARGKTQGRRRAILFLLLCGMLWVIASAGHFLLDAPPVGGDRIGAWVWLAALGAAGLCWIVTVRRPLSVVHRSAPMWLLVLLVAAGGATAYARARATAPVNIRWILERVGEGYEPATLNDRRSWNERYSSFELHPNLGKNPNLVPRAHTNLPIGVRLFGATLRFWVTQPERVVIRAGQATAGDGVDVQFVAARKGQAQLLQHVSLRMQRDPEQRRWEPVHVKIPPGTTRLTVEALQGPDGSTNWFDRVWVSPATAETPAEHAGRAADWIAVAMSLLLLGIAVLPPRFTKAPEDQTPLSEWDRSKPRTSVLAGTDHTDGRDTRRPSRRGPARRVLTQTKNDGRNRLAG